MKLNYISAIALTILLSITGCIKNDPVLFTGKQAEIDATVLNGPAVGLTYPIIARNLLATGRAVAASDSTLRRNPQTIRVRLNLLGPQSGVEETVGYEIVTSPPITTFAFPATVGGNPPLPQFQSPSAPAATLAITNATAGVNYTALSGKATFAPNSSFAFIDIQILNPGATAGAGKYIGIKLNSTGTIAPATNFSELGLVIDQR